MTSSTKEKKAPYLKPFNKTQVFRLGTTVLRSKHFVLYLTLLYFAVLWIFIPNMANPRNLANISSNMWPLLALAIGQMFVLIVGGIDLSQTSIMAMVSVFGAALMCQQADPALFENSPLWGTILTQNGGLFADSSAATLIAVVVMLLIGLLIGAVNGLSVAYLKIPPFIVTLVTMMFFSGLAILTTASENITHLPVEFIAIGTGNCLFLPISLIIVLLLVLVSHIVLSRTALGRRLYAVGLNSRTALFSGLPVRRLTVLAFMFSGFCAAVGAILYSARLEGGRPTLGQDLLLDIIGASVIGGISLFGGKGKVIWAFYGVLFFTLLANSLNMMNLSFFTINIVKGGVILLAAVLDVLRVRISAKGGVG